MKGELCLFFVGWICPHDTPADNPVMLARFIDAAKKIRDEEGASALWRAWWLTALGNVIAAFSS